MREPMAVVPVDGGELRLFRPGWSNRESATVAEVYHSVLGYIGRIEFDFQPHQDMTWQCSPAFGPGYERINTHHRFTDRDAAARYLMEPYIGD